MYLAVKRCSSFLSDKYDLTKHPNFQYTSDADKRNTFNIEKFISTKLKLKADDVFIVVDADASA